ncbi:ammonium transporter (plasmid) [Lichenicola cladoniae]|uniref:Ammonium transporter n=1 Tax=Lichenicola cladoniae TaxID=1484109 RepID=A0A6M8HY37_9PROT|nr:ammonium transporter [Lichenicola cladoniae]NPD66822.1 ammonium transporter [Acetobacteraceae bacterium]QKE93484.1 ammonium transporter [Lichenicola cladoniae]
MAFNNGSYWIGDLSAAGLNNSTFGSHRPFSLNAGLLLTLVMTVPQSTLVFFQMTFANIAPAVISGSFADRMKFPALVLFTSLWSLLLYAPVAH